MTLSFLNQPVQGCHLRALLLLQNKNFCSYVWTRFLWCKNLNNSDFYIFSKRFIFNFETRFTYYESLLLFGFIYFLWYGEFLKHFLKCIRFLLRANQKNEIFLNGECKLCLVINFVSYKKVMRPLGCTKNFHICSEDLYIQLTLECTNSKTKWVSKLKIVWCGLSVSLYDKV